MAAPGGHVLRRRHAQGKTKEDQGEDHQGAQDGGEEAPAEESGDTGEEAGSEEASGPGAKPTERLAWAAAGVLRAGPLSVRWARTRAAR
jgi:hypothetical protein